MSNRISSPLEIIARKPWLLIVAGFILLISVWTFFFIVALRNQPERLPVTGGDHPRAPASAQNQTGPQG